jgi:predicted transcriptional regulator
MSQASLVTKEDLKRLRRAAGLTQKQLAEKAGVSQSLIARIERGTVDPRFSTVRRIMSALEPLKSTRTAEDIMSSPVEGIDSRDSVRAAIDKMKKTGFSQLPVLMDGRIVGSVHESMILERIARSSNPERTLSSLVYNIMDKPFPTISPNESTEKIVNLLSSGEPALLVVENGLLVGIITKIDVLAVGVGTS